MQRVRRGIVGIIFSLSHSMRPSVVDSCGSLSSVMDLGRSYGSKVGEINPKSTPMWVKEVARIEDGWEVVKGKRDKKSKKIGDFDMVICSHMKSGPKCKA